MTRPEAAEAAARAPAPRYLEDLTIGETIETGALTITREMLVAFAEEFDPQPMHLDDDAARHTIFGELVGSGWQTLLVTMRLMIEARMLGGTPIVAGGVKDVRFRAPLRAGDTLRARAEIVGVRQSGSRPDRGFAEVKVTTTNADGATLVTQLWTLVVPTRDAARTWPDVRRARPL